MLKYQTSKPVMVISIPTSGNLNANFVQNVRNARFVLFTKTSTGREIFYFS